MGVNRSPCLKSICLRFCNVPVTKSNYGINLNLNYSWINSMFKMCPPFNHQPPTVSTTWRGWGWGGGLHWYEHNMLQSTIFMKIIPIYAFSLGTIFVIVTHIASYVYISMQEWALVYRRLKSSCVYTYIKWCVLDKESR